MDVFHLGPEERLLLYNTLLGDPNVDLPIGSWEWEPATNQIMWSTGTYKLLGLEPNSIEPTAESLYSRVHPDDLPALMANVEAAAKTDSAPPMEYRIIRPDGTIRHIRARGRRLVSATGGRSLLIGTVTDITAEKEAAEPYQPMLLRVDALTRRIRLFEPKGGGGGVAVFQNKEEQLSCLQHDLLRLLLDRQRQDQDKDLRTAGFVSSVEMTVTLPWETARPTAANVKQLMRRMRSLLKGSGLVIESQRGFGYRLWHDEG